MDLSELKNCTHSYLTIESKVPPCTMAEECCVGIDEAGRGPVLGEYLLVIIITLFIKYKTVKNKIINF